MCFLPALFEEGFAGGCAEAGIAGRGMATSAGDTSVKPEDPLSILPSILVFLSPLVAHGRPQLVSASGHPELRSGGLLLAGLGQPRQRGCLFLHSMLFPIFDEI